MKSNVLLDESKILVYVHGKRNYLQHLSKSSVSHFSMTEHRLHYWRFAVGAGELLARVDYTLAPPFSYVATTKNVTAGISLVWHSEPAFGTAQDSSCRPCKFYLKQKPTSLLRWILRNIMNSGALPSHPGIGTGSYPRHVVLKTGKGDLLAVRPKAFLWKS